ncbi:MAG: hypothetical protein ACJA1Z_001602 [Patiriisocius sp.]|jgi:hypothetical protein
MKIDLFFNNKSKIFSKCLRNTVRKIGGYLQEKHT